MKSAGSALAWVIGWRSIHFQDVLLVAILRERPLGRASSGESRGCRESMIPCSSNRSRISFGLISKINPKGREHLRSLDANSKLPAPNMKICRAQCSSSVAAGSVSPQIVGKIDRGCLDIDQCFGRHAFGINHVMAFEFDVKELKFRHIHLTSSRVMVVPLISSSAGTNDAIDQQGVSARHVEIGVRERQARERSRQCELAARP